MITIYGKENCPWCVKAKELAEQYRLNYKYIDLETPGARDFLKNAVPEAKTVPQIWWYRNHLGGYNELATMVEQTIGGYGEGET